MRLGVAQGCGGTAVLWCGARSTADQLGRQGFILFICSFSESWEWGIDELEFECHPRFCLLAWNTARRNLPWNQELRPTLPLLQIASCRACRHVLQRWGWQDVCLGQRCEGRGRLVSWKGRHIWPAQFSMHWHHPLCSYSGARQKQSGREAMGGWLGGCFKKWSLCRKRGLEAATPSSEKQTSWKDRLPLALTFLGHSCLLLARLHLQHSTACKGKQSQRPLEIHLSGHWDYLCLYSFSQPWGFWSPGLIWCLLGLSLVLTVLWQAAGLSLEAEEWSRNQWKGHADEDGMCCCRQALGGKAQEFSVIHWAPVWATSGWCFGGIQNIPTLWSSPVCMADRHACIRKSSLLLSKWSQSWKYLLTRWPRRVQLTMSGWGHKWLWTCLSGRSRTPTAGSVLTLTVPDSGSSAFTQLTCSQPTWPYHSLFKHFCFTTSWSWLPPESSLSACVQPPASHKSSHQRRLLLIPSLEITLHSAHGGWWLWLFKTVPQETNMWFSLFLSGGRIGSFPDPSGPPRSAGV